MDEGVQASDAELEHICRLVTESVEQGAVGFSTSRFLGHFVPDGRLTPGTWADPRWTEAIQQAVVDGGGVGGLFQVAPDMQTRLQGEFQMFERGAELGCHVMYSVGAGERGDGGVARTVEFLDRNNRGGRRVTSICHTRPSGAMFGLARAAPFRNTPWKELMQLPTMAERLEALKDPATKARLIRRSKETGFSADIALMHPMGIGETPEYDLARVNSLEQLADSGAHVGILTDTDSPTFLLSELTRRQGVYALPEAIHRITQASADVLDLKDRGSVKEGWIADLNVIDYDGLETGYPYFVNDFPHNGGRYIVESQGYVATLVGGQIIVENGKHTGNRPGHVIRDFARS